MKQIILGIFFLFTIVWGWNTMEEKNAELVTCDVLTESAEATSHPDKVVCVLLAANSFADVSVRPGVNISCTNFVRRYRPAGYITDYWFERLMAGQNIIFDNTLKSNIDLSQEFAALLKNKGYFIYSLRKIII